MNSKLKLIVPLVVVALAGGGYKFALAKPADSGPPPKIEGEVYVLPKEFLVNLDGGQYAKLGVALVFDHGFTAAPEGGGHGAPAKPPEGFGVLPQEPVVRAIVTDELTGAAAKDLTSSKGREKMKEHILERLHEESDVEVEDVLFTDIAVQ